MSSQTAVQRVLLVTTGKVGPDDIPPKAGAAEVRVDLDKAALGELTVHAEEQFASATVVASTWARLRAALAPLRLLGTTADVTVRVLREPVEAGRAPTVGALPRTRVVRFSASSPKGGGTTLETFLSRAAPLHDVVRGMTGQWPRLLAPGLRVALADRDAERFVIGHSDVRYVGVDDAIDAGGMTVPMAEIVVAGRGLSPDDDRPQVRFASANPLGDPQLAVPPVDTVVVNPIGFDNGNHSSDATIELAPSGHLVLRKDDGSSLGRIPRDGLLPGPQLRRLRKIRAVTVDPLPPAQDLALATVLTQVAAAGVPLVVKEATEGLRRALGPDMTAAITAVQPAVLRDPVRREAASIRLRREALRHHGTAARWREVGRRLGQPVPDEPLVSVVLTTRRPYSIDTAVRQIAQQIYPRLE
ncbi:MAG: hypothetical protein GEU74_08220, partial [Nitriliruptorales bacterium]|nr:hypothetical protein [Nitriliruptorales bacterium]